MQKSKQKIISLFLTAVMVFGLFTIAPTTALATLEDYDPGDVAVINAIIDNNGLIGYTKNDPDNWSQWGGFVRWDISTPRRITHLSLGSKNLMGTLDLTELTNLEYLNCSANNLSALNLIELTNLTELNCASNNLSTLDLTGLTNLTVLECSVNNLSTLDLSGLTKLVELSYSNNNLSTLDLSELASALCQLNIA